MSKPIHIADAELAVIKVLWEHGPLTLPELFTHLTGNKSTLKTLLLRLVQRGAVSAAGESPRTNVYTPVVTQDEYVSASSKSFLAKVFDGSAEKMLLNFVKEENISREDLQRLFEIVEE